MPALPRAAARLGSARRFRSGAQRYRFLGRVRRRETDFRRFLDFKEELEALLDRRIDLVDRKAIETSRNYIRKRHILAGAEPIYAA